MERESIKIIKLVNKILTELILIKWHPHWSNENPINVTIKLDKSQIITAEEIRRRIKIYKKIILN